MFTYYRDVTLYALGITLFTSMASIGAFQSLGRAFINGFLIFGIFGTGLGVLAFNYFQKAQYYMYHNLGFTKSELILKTWGVNFCISIVLIILIGVWL
jgi:hypothetical protein